MSSCGLRLAKRPGRLRVWAASRIHSALQVSFAPCERYLHLQPGAPSPSRCPFDTLSSRGSLPSRGMIPRLETASQRCQHGSGFFEWRFRYSSFESRRSGSEVGIDGSGHAKSRCLWPGSWTPSGHEVRGCSDTRHGTLWILCPCTL